MLKSLIRKFLLGAMVPVWATAIAGAQADQTAGPGPNPYTIILAGDKILAVDLSDQLWQRDDAQGGKWAQVHLTSDLPDFHPLNLACADAPHDVCLFTVTDGHDVHRVLYWLNSAKSLPLHIPAEARYLAFHDQDSLYYTLSGASGRELHLYNFASQVDKVVDTLSTREALAPLNVDGQTQDYIGDWASLPVSIRPLGAHPATPVTQIPWREGMHFGNHGIFMAEFWHVDRPVVEGARSEILLNFTHDKGTSGSQLKQNFDLVDAVPTNASLVPVFIQGATDGNDDFMAEATGPEGRSLGYVCSLGPQKQAFKKLMPVADDDFVSVSGFPSANGFLLESHGLTHSEQFKLIRLTPAENGALGRKCADTRVSITDLDVPLEDTSSLLSTKRQFATSEDGTKVPYLVVAPKGEITHVIIDVYGAFGLPRSNPYIGRDEAAHLAASHTAVVYATVRGDGDLGYDYAMASRSPNRMKSIEDVAAVGEASKALFPKLAAKPTVRGASAGGWLAVKAVLVHPELFAGAIGISGAYITDKRATDIQFFAPSDALIADVADAPTGCNGSAFRLLHTKNDSIVPYSDAMTFAHALEAKGCAVEFDSFDGGGHEIVPVALSPSDRSRRMDAEQNPF